MGFGSASHFCRNALWNLLPAYQSSGPFLASWSSIVFSLAGPSVWWQLPQFLALKTCLPSATPACTSEAEPKSNAIAEITTKPNLIFMIVLLFFLDTFFPGQIL